MPNEIVTTEEFKALLRENWSEQEFTDEVVNLAGRRGFLRIHFRAARTIHGWRCPLQGDLGFPDVVAIRVPLAAGEQPKFIATELKVGKNKPTEQQLLWLAHFAAIGADTFTWWPRDWSKIEEAFA